MEIILYNQKDHTLFQDLPVTKIALVARITILLERKSYSDT